MVESEICTTSACSGKVTRDLGRRAADGCWYRFALYWGSSVQCTQILIRFNFRRVKLSRIADLSNFCIFIFADVRGS